MYLVKRDIVIFYKSSVICECSLGNLAYFIIYENINNIFFFFTLGDGPTQPADFRSVVSSSHMYVLENGSLVIRDVEKQDAGLYLCEASNGVGASLAEVVKLSVNGELHYL